MSGTTRILVEVPTDREEEFWSALRTLRVRRGIPIRTTVIAEPELQRRAFDHGDSQPDDAEARIRSRAQRHHDAQVAEARRLEMATRGAP